MIVDMSKQKGDQTGERITPKHIYSNPFIPAICPILALALHVLGSVYYTQSNATNNSIEPSEPANTAGLTSYNSVKLFSGNPYQVFTNWLRDALSNNIPTNKL